MRRRALSVLVRRELFELVASGRALVLVLLAPPLIIFMVGELSVRPPAINVAITGAGAGNERAEKLAELLRQLPGLTVTIHPGAVADPLRFLGEARQDLVVAYNDLGTEDVRLYTAEALTSRAADIRRLALTVEEALASDSERIPENALIALGVLPPPTLYSYVHSGADRAAGFLPMTMALILCLLPFVLAAPSLVHEAERSTLTATLVAPGMTHSRYFIAKSVLPVGIAAFVGVLMAACVELFYQLHLKPGMLALGAATVLAAASSAFLGLAVSSLVRSSAYAMIASAFYFLCLLIFSGFFVPLDQSAAAIRAIAALLPVASLHAAVNTWLFGGDTSQLAAVNRPLAAQAAAYAAGAFVLYRWTFVRRI